MELKESKKTKESKLVAPIFNPKMSMTDYLDEVKKFEIKVKEEKYNKILKFINELLVIDCKSLIEIPPISLEKLISNKKYNKQIIDSNCKSLGEVLGINPLDIMIITDEEYYDELANVDGITDCDRDKIFTIHFIRKILDTIEYSLVTKYLENKLHYIIKSKKKYKKEDNSLKYSHYMKCFEVLTHSKTAS